MAATWVNIQNGASLGDGSTVGGAGTIRGDINIFNTNVAAELTTNTAAIGTLESTALTELPPLNTYLKYNGETDLIEATRPIQTTLNSFYLGGQHKISSGGENIFFSNLGDGTDYYPMWGGLKDHSIVANQDSSGVIAPSGRNYTEFKQIEQYGIPEVTGAIPYSDTSVYPLSVAGLGVEIILAESVEADDHLHYTIFIDGREVYKQDIHPGAKVDGDTLSWYFDHPVEVKGGTTISAQIHREGANGEDLGILSVRPSTDPSNHYYVKVYYREFTDTDLEFISPYLNVDGMDFSLEETGSSVLFKDIEGNVLAPYPINTLKAIAVGTTITIKMKDGKKVFIDALDVAQITIGGIPASSILTDAVNQLNALFTNTASFTTVSNDVTGFALVGNILTITLADASTFDIDVTSLTVDTDNEVVSGAVVVDDLVLTMSDASTVTIDISTIAPNTDVSHIPDVSNQTISIEEEASINYSIVTDTDGDIPTMYSFENLPSWLMGNQTTGLVLGTSPSYVGTPSSGTPDTYTFTVKAGNPYGITTSTVTVSVSEIANTTSWDKGITFDGSNDYGRLKVNDLSTLPLRRASNGDGRAYSVTTVFQHDGDEGWIWTSAKHATNTSKTNVGLFVQADNKVQLFFGISTNYLKKVYSTPLVSGTWYSYTVTFDGGTTGVSSGSMSDYYGRFKVYQTNLSTGVVTELTNSVDTHSNYGYTGEMDGYFSIAMKKNTSGPYRTTVAYLGITNSVVSTAQMSSFSIDPLLWINDNTITDPATSKVWLMGDGSLDVFPDIHNEVDTSDADSIMEMNNMTASDIVNVSTGL